MPAKRKPAAKQPRKKPLAAKPFAYSPDTHPVKIEGDYLCIPLGFIQNANRDWDRVGGLETTTVEGLSNSPSRGFAFHDHGGVMFRAIAERMRRGRA